MKQPIKKAKNKEKNTTEAQIGLFETISPLLHSAFDEVKEFSKKKQDEPLNVKKVKMINRLMEKAKEVLKNEPTVDFLDLLDDNELPSNSDAVLIMSQYISALNKFHNDHYHKGEWDMIIGGEWD
jgi:hypothetical protein